MAKPDDMYAPADHRGLPSLDVPHLYVLDSGIILRWVPGVGVERETSEGWKPYRELVKFAHEAMPITEEEAARIRGD